MPRHYLINLLFEAPALIRGTLGACQFDGGGVGLFHDGRMNHLRIVFGFPLNSLGLYDVYYYFSIFAQQL